MSPQELAPGTVVGGDYQVESTLAHGGMGVVYVATQLSTQKRRALKVMTPQPGDLEVLRKRFEREAHLGAKIESEHVVEVISAGVDPATKMPFMAMELLEGEDLDRRLERGRLAWGDAWNLVGELCHALEAAHRLGIVHRDLKPSNVFLARSRRPGVTREVKVLDFGIAKQMSDTGKTTGTLGTPLYMSPEQTMAGSTFTPATDVWALGLLLFEMLVGRPYWKTASADEAQIAMLLREVILEPLVPASLRAAELGCPDVLPGGFDAWFARCVDRDTTARWSTAGEAYGALAPIFAAATGRSASTLPAATASQLPAAHAASAQDSTAHAARTHQAFTRAALEPQRVPHRLGILIGGGILGAGLVVVAALALLSGRRDASPAAPEASPAPAQTDHPPSAAPPSIAPLDSAAPAAPPTDPPAPPKATASASAPSASTPPPLPPPASPIASPPAATGAPPTPPTARPAATPPPPAKDPVIL